MIILHLADFQTFHCLIISSLLCSIQTHRECLKAPGLRDEERKRVSERCGRSKRDGHRIQGGEVDKPEISR